jgi:TRAP-type mannitol/chloroaromatic compound transport system permease large subunit
LSNYELAIRTGVFTANAIAMQVLVDFPELMQYGYSSGNVEGEIEGDL